MSLSRLNEPGLLAFPVLIFVICSFVVLLLAFGKIITTSFSFTSEVTLFAVVVSVFGISESAVFEGSFPLSEISKIRCCVVLGIEM